MTDRCLTLTVVLETDMRVDDVESITSAIAQIRGVLDVEKNVADVQDYMAIARAREDLGRKILGIIYPRLRKESE
jgi:hypothetical protein